MRANCCCQVIRTTKHPICHILKQGTFTQWHTRTHSLPFTGELYLFCDFSQRIYLPSAQGWPWAWLLSTDPVFKVFHCVESWQVQHGLSQHPESSCRGGFGSRHLHLGGFPRTHTGLVRTPPVMEGRNVRGPGIAPNLHRRRSLGHRHAPAVRAALLSPGAASGPGRRGLHHRGRSLQSASGEWSPAQEEAGRAASGLPERLVPSPGLTPAGKGRGEKCLCVRYATSVIKLFEVHFLMITAKLAIINFKVAWFPPSAVGRMSVAICFYWWGYTKSPHFKMNKLHPRNGKFLITVITFTFHLTWEINWLVIHPHQKMWFILILVILFALPFVNVGWKLPFGCQDIRGSYDRRMGCCIIWNTIVPALLGADCMNKAHVDSQSILRCEASVEIAMEMAAKGEALHRVLHHQGKTLVANCVPEHF